MPLQASSTLLRLRIMPLYAAITNTISRIDDHRDDDQGNAHCESSLSLAAVVVGETTG